VKGTQFRVSLDQRDARVEVLRGQVQVSDFKTGQYALVNPDQVARVAVQGSTGLSLSGAGALSPIMSGAPRLPPVSPWQMMKEPTAVSERHAQNTQPAPGSAPVALPTIKTERAPRPSGGVGGWDSWFDSVLASTRSLFGGSGRDNREVDILSALTIPFTVGFGVALAVAVQRSRRKHKDKADDR
jgi:hypothetical protein